MPLSGWGRPSHCLPTFTDGLPKLYAYVHTEVTSAVARLDQFLSGNGVASDERVTVISDDAGEFAKTVGGSQLARGRVLDWFHIAMKFQAAQRFVFGSKMIDSLERESVENEIIHAKWLVWHGKGNKAVEQIKALDAQLLTSKATRIPHTVVETKRYLRVPEEKCAHVGQLRRSAPQGPARQQQHSRVRGEPGRQSPHGQEATEALDRRRGALHGAGQSRGFERGTLAPSHLCA
jgi:hypothetical protein